MPFFHHLNNRIRRFSIHALTDEKRQSPVSRRLYSKLQQAGLLTYSRHRAFSSYLDNGIFAVPTKWNSQQRVLLRIHTVFPISIQEPSTIHIAILIQ